MRYTVACFVKKNPLFLLAELSSHSEGDWTDTCRRDRWRSSPSRHIPQSPPEPSSHARSRSPSGRPPLDQVLGYALPQLGYVQLIPRTNPNRQFKFRRYVFSVDKPIRIRMNDRSYNIVPTREYIVLSTSSGNVSAILKYSGILHRVYGKNRNHTRVKIKMFSGTIDTMTHAEMRKCQVGKYHLICPRCFIEVVANQDSVQFKFKRENKKKFSFHEIRAKQRNCLKKVQRRE